MEKSQRDNLQLNQQPAQSQQAIPANAPPQSKVEMIQGTFAHQISAPTSQAQSPATQLIQDLKSQTQQ